MGLVRDKMKNPRASNKRRNEAEHAQRPKNSTPSVSKNGWVGSTSLLRGCTCAAEYPSRAEAIDAPSRAQQSVGDGLQ